MWAIDDECACNEHAFPMFLAPLADLVQNTGFIFHVSHAIPGVRTESPLSVY